MRNSESGEYGDLRPCPGPEDDVFDDDLLPSVSALRVFYAEAARRNNAVLLAIQ